MGETLTYAPHKAINSQALADFVAEWTNTQLPPTQVQAELWTMYFDGSLMKTRAGAGLLLISALGVHMRYVIRIHFDASNNVAEYEALVNGVRRLNVRGDSQLVIDQVMKASSYHDPKMEAYSKEVRGLEDKFHGLEHDDTTKQSTSSLRSHQLEAPSHWTHSRGTCTSRPST